MCIGEFTIFANAGSPPHIFDGSPVDMVTGLGTYSRWRDLDVTKTKPPNGTTKGKKKESYRYTKNQGRLRFLPKAH